MTAITTLKTQQTAIATAINSIADLEARIANAGREIDSHAGMLHCLNVLRDERRQLLGRQYLDGAKLSATSLDDEIGTLEIEVASAATVAEGASAAVELLAQQLSVTREQLASAEQQLPELLYAAHREHAQSAVADYRAALLQLASAQSVLQGRLAACDLFADPVNGRPVLAVDGVAASITALSPNLPGVSGDIDLRATTEAVLTEALATIGGADHQEVTRLQRIEREAEQAARRFDMGMASQLRRLSLAA